MPKTQTVNIAEAKGRPMLHWVGKRPQEERDVPARKATVAVKMIDMLGEEVLVTARV